MRTRVKICGLTHPDDVLATVRAGADAIGFVFAPGSKRLVTPEQAASLASLVPPFIARVGLFVDAPEERVLAVLAQCRLDVLQFHGDESPEYCARFQSRAKIIKALRVQDAASLQAQINRYRVDSFLLDAYVPGQAGGTGERFDWSIARDVVRGGANVILAGGLHPGNVVEAIRDVGPYALDVSSGVECSPGRKDADKVQAFIRAAQSN